MALTGGCLFLPEEEAAPEVELSETAAPSLLEYETVRRGDVRLTVTAKGAYTATRSESLYFTRENEKLETVYVAVGDTVEPGMLLAELDSAEMRKSLEDLEYQKAQLEMQVAKLDADYGRQYASLELQQQASPDEAQRQAASEAMASAGESYSLQRQILSLQLGKVEASLRETSEKLETYRIRATIGGTVTYLLDCAPGESPRTDKVFVTVSDESVSAFEIEGSAAAKFPDESTVTLTMDGTDYPGTVTGHSEDGKTAYVTPRDAEAVFYAGDKAEVTLILEEKKDVLYLPTELIRRSGETAYVFVTDDNGVLAMQEIRTGFTGDRTTEVVSGLDEGTEVVSR